MSRLDGRKPMPPHYTLGPIHLPGAIQPNGALLAVMADTLLVTHASANLAAVLGCPAEAVIGQPLEAVVGETACRVLSGAVSFDDATIGQICSVTGPGGGLLRLQAHQSGQYICIDIEPFAPAGDNKSLRNLQRSVLETFANASGPVELCELAVRGLQAITGYDRVMAYRFENDGHGQVIAEVCGPGLTPYLGLHFPAEDVPPEARSLFLRQRVGMIPDTSYLPVPLINDPSLGQSAPLDLTLSHRRSVSPIHREYLRNMGVAACLTLSLAGGHDADEAAGSVGLTARVPRLWGMLVCHSVTPRAAHPELREVTGLVAHVVALLLRGLAEAEVHTRQLARSTTLHSLADRLAAALDVPADLATIAPELLRLFDATGLVVRSTTSYFCFGQTPPAPAAARALTLLGSEAAGAVLAVDNLGVSCPELAPHARLGSGALLVPLRTDSEEAILWFRPEFARTVSWGGNPDKPFHVDRRTGRLHPRGSFAAWKQIVSGRSAPWEAADLAIAGQLRTAFAAAVAERTRTELARLRHYDPLTSLPNRSLLENQLREAERKPGSDLALLFLDLDGFKTINDTMGHAAGDALLVEVARRLLAAADPRHLVARLGGDEFVVLCPGLNRSTASALGERIRHAIAGPIEVCGRPCHVTASIGIAVAGQASGLDLTRAADMAMYAAKQAGGNRAVAFKPMLFHHASMQFELEYDMREALSSGNQFVLLYQPIFAVAGVKRLAGFEALVRWRHPRHGWLSPAKFILIAEKTGLIQPLGDWVLATGLRQGRVLRAAHPDANLMININVSPLQLPRPGLCISIAEALEAEGFPPAALCLEVTESMLTDAEGCAVLAQIRALGVGVAIDDFGIGYSSLSYLRRLPVDKVKLDRSFLEDMEGDPLGVGFVNAVVALAHAAGKPVVFEGIETQAQVDIAMGARAEMVQGYFFAPPLSAHAAEALANQYRQLDPRLTAADRAAPP